MQVEAGMTAPPGPVRSLAVTPTLFRLPPVSFSMTSWVPTTSLRAASREIVLAPASQTRLAFL